MTQEQSEQVEVLTSSQPKEIEMSLTIEASEEAIETRSPFWSFWRLWAVIAVVGCSATGVVAWRLLTAVPSEPSCKVLNPLAAEKEQLYCAGVKAQSGQLDDLLAALNMTANWPKTYPLYVESKSDIVSWSEGVLAIANRSMLAGDLDKALAIAAKIPKNSPAQPDVQRVIKAWKGTWQNGQDLYDGVQAAIQKHQWESAERQLKKLLDFPSLYWQRKAKQDLADRVQTEVQAWRELEKARQLANQDTIIGLGKAIADLKRLPSNTEAAAQAQTLRQTWSDRLLSIAIEAFNTQDWEAVSQATEQIPANAPQAAQAKDLLLLGRAQTIAKTNTLFAWLEAHAAASRVAPNSRPAAQANASLGRWETQVQDWFQLYYAKAIATVEILPAFHLADQQAQTIALGRPKRIAAQSLIAEWRKVIQQIEDRPYLKRAEQLARRGSIENLKGAIAQASNIQPGRSLYDQAQRRMTKWETQVQVIEDKPILQQARALAQKGNYWAAIDTADKIGSERALFDEARTLIQDWYYQAALAQDRRTLDEASALASQGQLTAAINLAAQVGYDRPLFEEAQAAIQNWDLQRGYTAPPPEPEVVRVEPREPEQPQDLVEPPPDPQGPPPEAEDLAPEPVPSESNF